MRIRNTAEKLILSHKSSLQNLFVVMWIRKCYNAVPDQWGLPYRKSGSKLTNIWKKKCFNAISIKQKLNRLHQYLAAACSLATFLKQFSIFEHCYNESDPDPPDPKNERKKLKKCKEIGRIVNFYYYLNFDQLHGFLLLSSLFCLLQLQKTLQKAQ